MDLCSWKGDDDKELKSEDKDNGLMFMGRDEDKELKSEDKDNGLMFQGRGQGQRVEIRGQG